jgi:hypothetical protein
MFLILINGKVSSDRLMMYTNLFLFEAHVNVSVRDQPQRKGTHSSSQSLFGCAHAFIQIHNNSFPPFCTRRFGPYPLLLVDLQSIKKEGLFLVLAECLGVPFVKDPGWFLASDPFLVSHPLTILAHLPYHNQSPTIVGPAHTNSFIEMHRY